jgi:predicted Zn-dependent protease
MSDGRKALKACAVVFMTALLALTSTVRPVLAQQSIPLLRDAETETYLRTLTDPIFRAAGIQPSAVTVYLVGDQSINAFVAGGQNLFVNTGLICAADYPNELVGVFAHETGHMAGGHLTRRDAAMGNIMKPFIVGMLLGVGAMAAGSPNLGQAVLAGSQQVAQRNALAFTRVQEASADAAAATYLQRAHESGRGLLQLFQKLRDDEVMSSNDPDPFIQTHPLPTARIAALRERMKASPYFDEKDSAKSIAELDLIKAKIHGFLDRIDVAQRRYPASDTSAPARYARAVIYHRQGKEGLAVDEVDSLIKDNPKDPYFYELKGQILYESGQAAKAVASYKMAVALASNQPLLRTGYGQALASAAEATGNKAQNQLAIDELKRATREDPSISTAWQSLAQAYADRGDEGMAQLSTAELYFNGGDYRHAALFAARARHKLSKGTVYYNRASDIVEVARASGADLRRSRNQ